MVKDILVCLGVLLALNVAFAGWWSWRAAEMKTRLGKCYAPQPTHSRARRGSAGVELGGDASVTWGRNGGRTRPSGPLAPPPFVRGALLSAN